ncbi:voltage-gated potassium channel [Hydrogenivirga caldilitoris]|uniref:Voltage-gated potassium channel n=1 Tax=Hydrogenivirga caldilitoris TaxID=246264 RepID=A0A497XQQ9_9AQUI|nr:ion channel [Hydrogenivirga caldilitoris]RLJ71228.1 voltage-gated potassium channel [Hydrogenivirga caldilitoris]
MVRALFYDILENDRSRVFILYQSFSFSVLMLSIVFTLYDELKGFHSDIHPLIRDFEFFVSGVILFEYTGRFILAARKLEYVLSPLSVLDLIAVIPYFQPFRLLRFVVIAARLMRVAYRYRYFVKGILFIFRTVSFEFYFLFSLFFLFFVSSVVITYSLEKGSGNPRVQDLFDALYLVVITMTTVGYGDITPVTWEGKVLSMLLGAGGLFLFSMSIAVVSAGFFNYVQMVRMGMISFKDMKDHIVICGWNETAQVIIESLKPLERDILLITTQDIPKPEDFHYKKGDFGREDILLDAGVDKAFMVIVLAEKLPGFSEDSVDARTILTGMQIRDVNKDVILVLEVLLRENAKLIKRRRIADYIIIGGELLGMIIAKFAREKFYGEFFSHIVEHIDLATLDLEEDSSVEEAEKKLEHKGYRIVGVVRDGRVVYFPRFSYRLRKGDKLLLIREHQKEEKE